MTENPPIHPVLIVYHHKPFEKGKELEEEAHKNSENILFIYPQKSDPEITEQLLSVFISLDTYSNLSLNSNHIDFLSLHEQKIAIEYYARPDNSYTVFILCLSSSYEDIAVKNATKQLMRGVFFILGPEGICNSQLISNVFVAEGERMINLVIPKDGNSMNISFPSLHTAEKHPSMLPTGLTELYMMNTDPRIWGISCFVDEQLLISMSPPSIVKLFQFSSPISPQDKVYLTKADREIILNEQNFKGNIPENDVIVANLMRFDKRSVTFFVLASEISEDLLLKVSDTINNKTIPHITSMQPKRSNYPNSLLMYDRDMMVVHSGQLSADSEQSAAFLHSMFIDEKRPAIDGLVGNFDEIVIGFNTHGLENYTTIPNDSECIFEELYSTAIHQSPQLSRYLSNIKQ